MVRRLASLLSLESGAGALAFGVPLLALVYWLVAPELPGLSAGDETVLVAGGVGLVVLSATTLALLPAYDTFFGPLLILLGAGMLMATLNASGVGAAANVAEAFVAGSVGLLFARALATPAIAVAVPVFVAAIDIWSVASGPTEKLLEQEPDPVDALSFDLPAWGHDGSVGQLGVSDAVFIAMFASYAWRFGFRRIPTLIGLTLALFASLAVGVATDSAIPALPFIAAGYLLPNLDLIPKILRAEKQAAA